MLSLRLASCGSWGGALDADTVNRTERFQPILEVNYAFEGYCCASKSADNAGGAVVLHYCGARSPPTEITEYSIVQRTVYSNVGYLRENLCVDATYGGAPRGFHPNTAVGGAVVPRFNFRVIEPDQPQGRLRCRCFPL